MDSDEEEALLLASLELNDDQGDKGRRQNSNMLQSSRPVSLDAENDGEPHIRITTRRLSNTESVVGAQDSIFDEEMYQDWPQDDLQQEVEVLEGEVTALRQTLRTREALLGAARRCLKSKYGIDDLESPTNGSSGAVESDLPLSERLRTLDLALQESIMLRMELKSELKKRTVRAQELSYQLNLARRVASVSPMATDRLDKGSRGFNSHRHPAASPRQSIRRSSASSLAASQPMNPETFLSWNALSQVDECFDRDSPHHPEFFAPFPVDTKSPRYPAAQVTPGGKHIQPNLKIFKSPVTQPVSNVKFGFKGHSAIRSTKPVKKHYRTYTTIRGGPPS